MKCKGTIIKSISDVRKSETSAQVVELFLSESVVLFAEEGLCSINVTSEDSAVWLMSSKKKWHVKEYSDGQDD